MSYRRAEEIWKAASEGHTLHQLRHLLKNYPHWNTVHRYHKRWSDEGVWAAVAAHVVGMVRQAEGRDAEPSAGIVDS